MLKKYLQSLEINIHSHFETNTFTLQTTSFYTLSIAAKYGFNSPFTEIGSPSLRACLKGVYLIYN